MYTQKSNYCPSCKTAMNPGSKSCRCGWSDGEPQVDNTICNASGCPLPASYFSSYGCVGTGYCTYHLRTSPQLASAVSEWTTANLQKIITARKFTDVGVPLRFDRERYKKASFPLRPNEKHWEYAARLHVHLEKTFYEMLKGKINVGA